MSANPVNAWDARLLAFSETAFATPPVPANPAAYAAGALEFISAKLGPVEVGQVRDKKDRSQGRGMRSGYVEGRVVPMPWSVQLSVKTRSAIDADPRELVLYKAAGLKKTINAAVSTVLSPSATPIESGDFASAVLTRPLGASSGVGELETLRGCVCTSLKWEGGDKEVLLTAGGNGVGKFTSGVLDSVTLASGVVTTLTHTAEESYRLAPGYYLCESEVIQVTVVGYGSTSSTIVRAALGTTGAAHTTKAFAPYLPPGITYAGSPIAEPVATCSIGGVTIRMISWSVDFTSGMDHLPGETGSKYVQGAKYARYDIKVATRLVLSQDQVSLLGKATQRPNVAVSLSQGAGVGGIWTFAAANAEVEPFTVPDTANDVAIVDVTMRVRDSGSSSDMFSITLT